MPSTYLYIYDLLIVNCGSELLTVLAEGEILALSRVSTVHRWS